MNANLLLFLIIMLTFFKISMNFTLKSPTVVLFTKNTLELNLTFQFQNFPGPVNQTVSEGNLVTLHCQFTTKDKARVSWLKEGIPIEFSDNDRYYLTDGYNLQIKGVY